jgi:hypothetical protein
LKYGRLTILKIIGSSNDGHAICEFSCDCGNVTTGQWKRSRSCGCLQKEEASKVARSFSLGVRAASFHRLFNSYKNQAKRRNIEFTLPRDTFAKLTSSPCHYCGKEPSQSPKGDVRYNGIYVHNGVDRVDPEKGYVEMNCVPCCWCCNNAKSSMSINQFLSWVRRVHEHSNHSSASTCGSPVP